MGAAALRKVQTVRVLDATVLQLLNVASRKMRLTYVDRHLETWPFLNDDRNKLYEVQLYTPDRTRPSPAPEHVPFKFSSGFAGNTAAFISWLIEAQPEGCTTTVPHDALLYPYAESLWAPHYLQQGSRRELHLVSSPRFVRTDSITFVAFREIEEAG